LNPMATSLLLRLSFQVSTCQAYFFFSVGDWGGLTDVVPTTAVEKHNALSMAAVSKALDPDEAIARFALLVGDNFYSSGIQGDESSWRFNATFENAFPESHEELRIPFYAVAGNHDHKGNVSAQIAYAQHSSRWTFDDIWYTFTEEADGVSTQIVYIDTVTLAGMSYEDESTGMFVEDEYHPIQLHADAQLEWLESTLNASTADYLWISGHYPIYSHCSHGPNLKLQSSVLPLMRKYRATGYIAGHDHCSSYYFDEGMAHVLAGAGMECCYQPKNLDNHANPGQPLFRMDLLQNRDDTGGFASYTVSASNTTIRFHAANGGRVQYTAEPILPRTTIYSANESWSKTAAYE